MPTMKVHRKRVSDALVNGIRNLTGAEYAKAAKLAGPYTPGEVKGWPDDAPVMFNASGDPCDMWSGPCSCGAWHREGI